MSGGDFVDALSQLWVREWGQAFGSSCWGSSCGHKGAVVEATVAIQCF